tara:strand:- start:287 stop:1738 length:1452 start_codon:yes stop_codon:yes gene_type:complete
MESEFYKKASQAKGSYGDRRVTQGDILLVYDAGLFSTGKRGFFLTDDAIYYKSKYGAGKVHGKIAFEDLDNVSLNRFKGGESYSINLNYKDGYSVEINIFGNSQKEDKSLEKMLNEIISNSKRKSAWHSSKKNPSPNKKSIWTAKDKQQFISECIESSVGDEVFCDCIFVYMQRDFKSLEDMYADPMKMAETITKRSSSCQRKSDLNKQKPSPDPNKIYSIEDAGSIVLGNPNATVTIVKWMSFQCPYCSKSTELVNNVLKKYPNDVKVVIKNFPLNFHKQARRAAQYALAAEKVKPGSYKEMYYKIFTDYRSLRTNPDMPLEVAKSLGIDVDAVVAVANDPSIDAQIEREINQLKNSGIPRLSVPKFLVAGKEPQGRNLEVWSALIEAELKNRQTFTYTLKNNKLGTFKLNSDDLSSIRFAMNSGKSIIGLAIAYDKKSEVITIKKSDSGEILEISSGDVRFIYFNYKDDNRKIAKFVEVSS